MRKKRDFILLLFLALIVGVAHSDIIDSPFKNTPSLNNHSYKNIHKCVTKDNRVIGNQTGNL
jgi:hypothetical protein